MREACVDRQAHSSPTKKDGFSCRVRPQDEGNMGPFQPEKYV